MLKLFCELVKDESAENEYILCVTGDHTTPVRNGDHTFEPVPVSIALSSNLLNTLELRKQTDSRLALLNDSLNKFDELTAA